jgi:hypothetical protein
LFGSFLPPDPLPQPLFLLLPSLPYRSCSALISNFVEVRHKHNKENKVFLLVEIRIATQRDS